MNRVFFTGWLQTGNLKVDGVEVELVFTYWQCVNRFTCDRDDPPLYMTSRGIVSHDELQGSGQVRSFWYLPPIEEAK
jgi:hypothetical protein